MAKVVLDTNVLLDIFVFEDPSVLGVWELVKTGRHQPYYSSVTLKEFINKLADEKFSFSKDKQDSALSCFLDHSMLAEADKLFPLKCKDAEDQKFLNLALSITPSYLITWDKAVLKLRKRSQKEGFSILTPTDFLNIC